MRFGMTTGRILEMRVINERLGRPRYAALYEDRGISWAQRCRTPMDVGRRPLKKRRSEKLRRTGVGRIYSKKVIISE